MQTRYGISYNNSSFLIVVTIIHVNYNSDAGFDPAIRNQDIFPKARK